MGSAGTKKKQIANVCTGWPCIRTRHQLQIEISVIAPTKLRSGLILRTIPWGAPTLRGGMETKPDRITGNLGVSFPPAKQNQSVCHPGPFHENRNSHIGLFFRFLAHSGAPRKQTLKSPCFVSSNFSCFNFFPSLGSYTGEGCHLAGTSTRWPVGLYFEQSLSLGVWKQEILNWKLRPIISMRDFVQNISQRLPVRRHHRNPLARLGSRIRGSCSCHMQFLRYVRCGSCCGWSSRGVC